jgi:hypothetical protein
MRFFIIPMVAVFLMACKNTENATNENPTVTTTSSDSDSICRFQVSFISIGSGPDRQAKKTFNTFITDFNQLNKLSNTHIVVNWGREGEQDYCFSFLGINPEVQEKFISESKLLFANNALVKCFVNAPYLHTPKD